LASDVFADMAVVIETIENMEQYHLTNPIRKKMLVYLGTKILGFMPGKGPGHPRFLQDM